MPISICDLQLEVISITVILPLELKHSVTDYYASSDNIEEFKKAGIHATVLNMLLMGELNSEQAPSRGATISPQN